MERGTSFLRCSGYEVVSGGEFRRVAVFYFWLCEEEKKN